MPIVPRHLLPVLLSNEVHAALADLQTAVVTALESLRQDDPIIYSQVEEAARHHLAGDSVTVYE